MTKRTTHPLWMRNKDRKKHVTDGGQIPAAAVPFMPSVRVTSKGEVVAAVPQDDDVWSNIHRLGTLAGYRINLEKALNEVPTAADHKAEIRALAEWGMGRVAITPPIQRLDNDMVMPIRKMDALSQIQAVSRVQQYLVQRRFDELLHFTVDTYIRYGTEALEVVRQKLPDDTLKSAFGQITYQINNAETLISLSAWLWALREEHDYRQYKDPPPTYSEYLDYLERNLNSYVESMASNLESGLKDAEDVLEFGPGEMFNEEDGEQEERPDPPTTKRVMEDLKEVERFKFKNVASNLGFAKLVRLPVELDRTWPGLLSRKKIPTDSGRKPRRYNRALIDGRIFDARTRALGGIVIIDWSGSMSLPASAVEKMFMASPGCVVAVYGYGHAHNFAVLAQRGRRTSKPLPEIRAKLGGGNGVDGPALVWGINQRRYYNEPIIWVSDGCVTGVGENTDNRLYHYCAALVHNYNIYHVLTIGEGVELIEKLVRRDSRANIYRGNPRGGLEGYGENVSKYAWFKGHMARA